MAKGVVILAVCILCGGCVSPSRTVRPHRDYLCWSSNLEPGAYAWLAEARTRFKDPFLFIVHGDIDGRDCWRSAADDRRRCGDVRMALWMLRDMIGPQRPIIFLSCNEGSPPFDIDVPGVFYVHRPTWSFPFSAMPWLPEDEAAGSIWEFQTYPTTRPSTRPTSRP